MLLERRERDLEIVDQLFQLECLIVAEVNGVFLIYHGSQLAKLFLSELIQPVSLFLSQTLKIPEECLQLELLHLLVHLLKLFLGLGIHLLSLGLPLCSPPLDLRPLQPVLREIDLLLGTEPVLITRIPEFEDLNLKVLDESVFLAEEILTVLLASLKSFQGL